ncbi:GNAT family N-acetyltransferase [Sutcliffiella horikoshii]|uniref:GNAT family N-acetyltransferase n=1 Tax=Sutcliffiella horikoshii TaxID=79883 RepID=UPI00203FF645|nr:GNAT family protein [Sutcliffiella horikoshii]MCM3617713.1 GNAT family N-acetyltransferase [Sutcliffiella horikoshii]
MSEFPILETERLILREVATEDAIDMFEYLSDKDVVTHMGLEPYKSSKDVLNEEIKWYKSIVEEGTGIRWVITKKESSVVIGSCGFLNMSPKHHRAEIGFELHKEYWGQGIASEAVEAVIDYGYENLNLERIEAIVDPPNFPSQKLMEKQGFRKEGLLRNYEYNFGKFNDVYMYSMIREDFNMKEHLNSASSTRAKS